MKSLLMTNRIRAPWIPGKDKRFLGANLAGARDLRFTEAKSQPKEIMTRKPVRSGPAEKAQIKGSRDYLHKKWKSLVGQYGVSCYSSVSKSASGVVARFGHRRLNAGPSRFSQPQCHWLDAPNRGDSFLYPASVFIYVEVHCLVPGSRIVVIDC
jgi:hypothetical protein